MTNADALLAEYEAAVTAHCDICAAAPEQYHVPDAALFRSVRLRLKRFADFGDVRCQYAIATILSLGLCHQTEEQQHQQRNDDMIEASRLWEAAATEGHLPALYNLITSGIGPAADRAREAMRQVEQGQPELISGGHGMPVYGWVFMETVRRSIYGNTRNG